jgi:hypothetical protein
MRKRFHWWIRVLILVFVLGTTSSYAQDTPSDPAIVVLKIQGKIDFTRQGWVSHQAIAAGTLISPTDLIFPQDATLLVMCPDSSVREFLPSDLIPNSRINCPANPADYVVGEPGLKRTVIRRGGRQSPTIPYLISPRETVVRQSQVEIVWNAIPNVQSYSITVRGGSTPWTSDPLDPATVTQGSIARISLPQALQEKTAYTVEICVVFTDTHRQCTTDADWSSAENLAFYYVPTPALDQADAQLINGLGADTPEALYARAVLLSQPIFQVSGSTRLGVNGEAIALLENLIKAQGQTALAKSPDLYTLLGDLYHIIDLPISAARAYQQAGQLADSGTAVSAKAALGLALTTPDGAASIKSYNQALDSYAAFLSKEAFAARLTELCGQIGDLKFDIERCAAQ